MDGGDDTFYTVSYLQRVEGRRKDVTAFDRGGVVFPGFYGSDFRSLTRQEKDSRRQQVERATLPGQSPVYYSTMNEKILPDVPLVQEGILYNAKSHERRSSPWPLYDLRGIAPWTAPSLARIIDYRTRALVPFYAYQRSVESGTQAHWEEALGFALSAHAIGSDVHWLIPNLVYNTYVWGQAQFQSGQMATAERVYRLTVLWDPRASAAWSNLGAIAERNQRLDEAVSYYQKAIELDPASESAHYNLAVVYWKKSDWPRVINTLQRVLAINPNNPSARNYLRQAQARQGPSQ
jgi:tetratricopeptide (TPR) repeat protein